MSRFKEFWQIESGMRCPVCKSEEIKNVIIDGLPCGECRKCKTRFKNYGFSWLELLYTFISIVLVEALMIKVFLPNNINRITTLIVMVVLVILFKELLAYAVYALFGKTKVTVVREKIKVRKGEDSDAGNRNQGS